jgi:hypothetical protein
MQLAFPVYLKYYNPDPTFIGFRNAVDVGSDVLTAVDMNSMGLLKCDAE